MNPENLPGNYFRTAIRSRHIQSRKISVALALTDLFLEKLGKGICRIHGGGFAGVIMCVVPEEETENYVSYISEFAGKENVYPMNIRAVGAVHIANNLLRKFIAHQM